MAEDLPSRTAERELISERMDAEAESRRDESAAAVMRSHALRLHAISPGLAALATEATERETKSAKRLADVNAKTLAPDLEGTSLPLADRTGTFASDIFKATAGGVGVEDSNTSGETTATNLVHTETTAEASGEEAAAPKRGRPRAN